MHAFVNELLALLQINAQEVFVFDRDVNLLKYLHTHRHDRMNVTVNNK